jgi:hypothetical protein
VWDEEELPILCSVMDELLKTMERLLRVDTYNGSPEQLISLLETHPGDRDMTFALECVPQDESTRTAPQLTRITKAAFPTLRSSSVLPNTHPPTHTHRRALWPCLMGDAQVQNKNDGLLYAGVGRQHVAGCEALLL